MITALIFLIIQNAKSSMRYLRSQTVGKITTVFIALLLVISVELVLYRLGKSGLEFIQGYSLYREAFTLYVYELYMAVLLYLSAFSAMLVILFTLLKSGKEDWIISTPRFEAVPYFYIFKITLSTLIPLTLLGLPLILAMKTVMGLGIIHVMVLFASLIIFISISILFSMILIFGSASVLLAVTRKTARLVTLIDIVAVVVIVFLVSIFFGWKQAFPKDFIEFWQIPETEITEFNVDLVSERFSSFPSHTTALSMYYTSEGFAYEATLFIAQNVMVLIALFIAVGIPLRWFLPIWQKLQEGSFEARTKVRNHGLLKFKEFPMIFKSPVGALLEKEFLVMGRGLKDVIWTGFILSIWLFYTGINVMLRNAMRRYGVAEEEILTLSMHFRSVLESISSPHLC